MTTRLPALPPPFTPEQCQILGDVYSLILSWRKEDKKTDSINSDATKANRTEVEVPNLAQNGGSDE